MASSEPRDVTALFIQPLLLHFLPPSMSEDEVRALWADFQADLGEFDAQTLAEAVINLRRGEGKSKTFPRLAECRAVCRNIDNAKRAASQARRQTADEMAAERSHLGRLNQIEGEGDSDRAARLLIILAVRASSTGAWDFGQVNLSIRRRAVDIFCGPKWLLNGKRPNLPQGGRKPSSAA
jgi:hypothetical protein